MLNKLREILRVEGLSGIKIRVYGRFLKAKYRYLSIMASDSISRNYLKVKSLYFRLKSLAIFGIYC